MLELKNVVKTFNLTGAKEDLRVALNNVTLKVAPGEFVTIIGSNGSGKSTTLNVTSGTLIPEKGLVLLNNVDITKLSEHRRAAYFGRVFQDPMMGTAADMSVLENLEVAYRRGRFHSPIAWGFRKSNKEYFINELKRFDLGLEDRLNQKVGVMSGGQRQALTLLMATMRQRPSLYAMRKDYVKFANLEDYDFEAVSTYNMLRSEIISKYDKLIYKENFEYKKLKKDGGVNSSVTSDHNEVLKDLKNKEKEELHALSLRKKNALSEKKRIENLAKVKFDTAKKEMNAIISSFKAELHTQNLTSKEVSLKLNEKKELLMEEFAKDFDLTKQILLLDEHTAALDPKTARKVLELTEKIVREKKMTTLMVTHNMKDALKYGDRLIMFHSGNIILDVKGKAKDKLQVNDLLQMFEEADERAEKE